jgi:hypothetical protein
MLLTANGRDVLPRRRCDTTDMRQTTQRSPSTAPCSRRNVLFGNAHEDMRMCSRSEDPAQKSAPDEDTAALGWLQELMEQVVSVRGTTYEKQQLTNHGCQQ